MPLFYTDTAYQLRLMATVDDAFDDNPNVSDEEIENMLDEVREMFPRRKPLQE
jgi:hypothetical protein